MIGIGKKEAKKVVLCPADENIWVYIPSSTLKKDLIGKIVSVGEEIPVPELRKRVVRSKGFEEFFEEFEDVFGIDIPLKVIETEPEGEVKITNNTQIVFLESIPDEYGFPIAKVVNIKTKPNVNDMLEVKDVESMKKLARSMDFINKYEDGNEIIYFVREYYYRITK